MQDGERGGRSNALHVFKRHHDHFPKPISLHACCSDTMMTQQFKERLMDAVADLQRGGGASGASVNVGGLLQEPGELPSAVGRTPGLQPAGQSVTVQAGAPGSWGCWVM